MDPRLFNWFICDFSGRLPELKFLLTCCENYCMVFKSIMYCLLSGVILGLLDFPGITRCLMGYWTRFIGFWQDCLKLFAFSLGSIYVFPIVLRTAKFCMNHILPFAACQMVWNWLASSRSFGLPSFKGVKAAEVEICWRFPWMIKSVVNRWNVCCHIIGFSIIPLMGSAKPRSNSAPCGLWQA